MKKVAIVIPWYGENIPGGAEMECRGIAKNMNKRGINVEILTTCVKEFNSDWNKNYYKQGVEKINGITVRRFQVRKRDTRKFDEVNYKLIHNMKITKDEEEVFFNEMVYSEELNKFIQDTSGDYKAFLFIPYMFGTTYWGSKICPSKSILIPCLHDESYAYMKLITKMFEQNTKGLIFNAKPEMELAKKIYKLNNVKHETIGLGIEEISKGTPLRFRMKYNIKNPFLLYAGRKDKGKNVDTLINYFSKYKSKHKDIRLDLVLIGGGTIEDIPENITDNVYDLGFVPIEDKYDAFSASEILCQPSNNESFSIVIMESWLSRRPVLVSARCDVTKNFAIESNGGLYFDDYYEFEECVNYMLKNKHIGDKMGTLGYQYVKENFTWDVVISKIVKFINDVMGDE